MGGISARVLHGLGYPTGEIHNFDETGEKLCRYCLGNGCWSDQTPEQRGSVTDFVIASGTGDVIKEQRSKLKPSLMCLISFGCGSGDDINIKQDWLGAGLQNKTREFILGHGGKGIPGRIVGFDSEVQIELQLQIDVELRTTTWRRKGWWPAIVSRRSPATIPLTSMSRFCVLQIDLEEPDAVVIDDIFNKQMSRVLQCLWSFHMDLKLQLNLDFRESEPTFVPPIPSPPWPRINTRVSTSAVSHCKFASAMVGGLCRVLF